MALFDFFKPKWKSKNPEARLGAVQSMGAGEVTTLKALAGGDEDVRVQLAAVERIGDRAPLEELAGTIDPGGCTHKKHAGERFRPNRRQSAFLRARITCVVRIAMRRETDGLIGYSDL
jgi:hypothetical protein